MGKRDITHKSFFENAEWFADLMNAAFFGGEKIVEAKELLPEDGAIQKADNAATVERLRDVVKRQAKDGSIFAMYILESQSTVDYGMLIRVMVEESLTYDKQIKQIRRRNKEKYGNVLKEDEFICGFRRNDRLAPVFSLVLYWGDKEWDAINSLPELVDIPAASHNLQKQVRELVPNYRIKVLDLNNVKDFSLFKTTLRTIFEFYSFRKNKDGLKKYLSTHEAEVRGLDEESRFLLSTMIKEKRLLRQLKKMEEAEEMKNKKEEEDLCQAIQEMIDEGREEGRIEGEAKGKEEGRIEGKEEGRLSAFKQMVSEGHISIEVAAEHYGITVAEMKKRFAG